MKEVLEFLETPDLLADGVTLDANSHGVVYNQIVSYYNREASLKEASDWLRGRNDTFITDNQLKIAIIAGLMAMHYGLSAKGLKSFYDVVLNGEWSERLFEFNKLKKPENFIDPSNIVKYETFFRHA